MPRYDYEPIDVDPERLNADPGLRDSAPRAKCDFCGGRFEVTQSIHEEPLAECPMCDRPVRRVIGAPALKIGRSNAELRDLGFTKLVKRADGTYENLTRRSDEPRIVDPRKIGPGGNP